MQEFENDVLLFGKQENVLFVQSSGSRSSCLFQLDGDIFY
jgi:hypothetical protein